LVNDKNNGVSISSGENSDGFDGEIFLTGVRFRN
jgi:hypothetical protein